MIGINLIPEEVQLKQARRMRFVRWGTVLAIGLSVLGVVLGVDVKRHARATELQWEEERTQAQLVQARKHLRELTNELLRIENQVEHARALRSKRAWSGMVALVARCLPDKCWLTTLSTDPAQPAQSVPTVERRQEAQEPGAAPEIVVIDAPRRLKLTGFAKEPSAPNTLVQNLQREGVFASVDLTNSHVEPVLDGTYYRFDVVCEW